MARKRAAKRKTPADEQFVAPERLYTLRGFYAVSGISAARMREARLRGVVCPMLQVGRRKFIRGTDGIAYIERLAAMQQGDG